MLRFALFCLTWVIAQSKTVIIGDSMFAGGSNIPKLLQEWSGHTIENYAKVGSSLHEGWVLSIPDQWDMIPSHANISTVIMDGGGNDIFSSQRDCNTLNQQCLNKIQECQDILQGLFEKMASQQIDHVLYLGFYYARGMNRAIDTGMESLKQVCNENGILPCFVIDPRNYSLPLGWDSIHPTNEGYRKLAFGIWDTALSKNVEI